ncbi:hypothetical protein AB3N04_00435 (plasmid) [Alkalihalophilus sp. As8PL]|uniref:Uncharacterized protein n=1 Tax=Alkalihalophilus sp. As8PL TaxID=3237103 RepID=A0AB39BNF2_9BACI
MKKFKGSWIILMVLLIIFIESALPKSIVNANQNMERYWGVDVNRLLVSPQGSIPTSGPHPNSVRGIQFNMYINDPLEGTQDAILHRTLVWNQVSSFRESILHDEYMTSPEIVNAENQSDVNLKVKSIIDRYPEHYKPVEAIVYPVHRGRTYPISEADAYMLMFRDNHNMSTDVLSRNQIGLMDMVGSQQRNLPHEWNSFPGSRSEYPWRPTNFPKVFDQRTFNSYEDVLVKRDESGNRPWLAGSELWKVWGEQELRNYVVRDLWHGRAHPVFYSPGNDPYMKNMKYSDWDYYRITDGMPSGAHRGFTYYNYHATRFENPLTDYRIQMKFEIPPPPVADFTWEPNTITEGDKVEFKDQSSHPQGIAIESWQWEWATFYKNVYEPTPLT